MHTFFNRLEWESAVLRGASTFQALEEERLSNLKTILSSYFHHSNDLGPRLIEVRISIFLHCTNCICKIITRNYMKHKKFDIV